MPNPRLPRAIICLVVLLTARTADAQNVLGAHQAPASPAEVQQQLERTRHDLDAVNRRSAECELKKEVRGAAKADGQPSPPEDQAMTACPP
jgi:hypothetical protein